MEKTLRIEFQNKQGLSLSGRLELPIGRVPTAYAVFAHCFTCSKDVTAASQISKNLTRSGFGVLRFDFTGLGNSDGDFSNTHFSSNLDDLEAAFDFLKSRYKAPELLVGHSLGGAAVLAVAERLPEIKAIATIGAPGDPSHVAHLFDEKRKDIESDGEAEVTLAGRKFRVKKEFLEDIAEQNQRSRINDLDKALIIFHSPQDEIVGIENAKEIFQNAKHPKSFISLEGADHLLTKKGDSQYVAELIATWASRYLSTAEELPISGGDVLVEEVSPNSTTQYALVRGHKSIIDEPLSVPAGKDLGPAPYDYLKLAIGGCTSITVRMVANKRKLELDGIQVKVSHEKTENGDLFRRELKLIGNLSSEDREGLLKIANKCPVHKTLTEGKITVETNLI